MPALITSLLLPMLLASAPEAVRMRGAAEAPTNPSTNPLAGTEFAQVTIEQRIIIRIPTMPRSNLRPSSSTSLAPPSPPAPPMRWKESKGPKCLPISRIRGASINMQDGVTMVTATNELFRAKFGRACRPADFYSGFYVEPGKDGALCAGRDSLHARNGTTCEIEKFSKMTAEMLDDDEDGDRRDK